MLPFEGQCPKKHLQHHKLLITCEDIANPLPSNLLAPLPTHPKISKNEQVRKALSSSQSLTRGRVTWKTTTRTRSPKTTPTGASTQGGGHSKLSRGSRLVSAYKELHALFSSNNGRNNGTRKNKVPPIRHAIQSLLLTVPFAGCCREAENPFVSTCCRITLVGLAFLEELRASPLPQALHLHHYWCLPSISSIRGHARPCVWMFPIHTNKATRRWVIRLRGCEAKSFDIALLSVPGHRGRSESSALASPLCFSACLTCP